MAQFIYVLEKARKAHGDKVVLDDVTLNFLPGAKIGVVGPNGAGKSSLLKIMAGIDTLSNGEARLIVGPPLNGLQANAAPDPAEIPNNHLSYAVQWFLFALTAAIIYVLALRKKWRAR